MAKTPMWAPGSNTRTGSGSRGFTLVELLLVLAIMAMASAGVVFALRDSSQTQLEREAQRLVALLDAARAQSRASGLPVYWHPALDGFAFVGLSVPLKNSGPGADAQETGGLGNVIPWLTEGIAVRDGSVVSLGPEPIIARQRIVLVQDDRSLRIETDGLHGFAIVETEQAGPAEGSP